MGLALNKLSALFNATAYALVSVFAGCAGHMKPSLEPAAAGAAGRHQIRAGGAATRSQWDCRRMWS